MDKQSNFINQRKRLLYPDGSVVQLGDTVRLTDLDRPALGTVTSHDYDTITIVYTDGKSVTVPVYDVERIQIIDELLKDAKWIKR